MSKGPRQPHGILTVIIRDDMPYICMQEPPRYRTVQLQLTEDQLKQIELRFVGMSCGEPIQEEISTCFLEDRRRPE